MKRADSEKSNDSRKDEEPELDELSKAVLLQYEEEEKKARRGDIDFFGNNDFYEPNQPAPPKIDYNNNNIPRNHHIRIPVKNVTNIRDAIENAEIENEIDKWMKPLVFKNNNVVWDKFVNYGPVDQITDPDRRILQKQDITAQHLTVFLSGIKNAIPPPVVIPMQLLAEMLHHGLFVKHLNNVTQVLEDGREIIAVNLVVTNLQITQQPNLSITCNIIFVVTEGAELRSHYDARIRCQGHMTSSGEIVLEVLKKIQEKEERASAKTTAEILAEKEEEERVAMEQRRQFKHKITNVNGKQFREERSLTAVAEEMRLAAEKKVEMTEQLHRPCMLYNFFFNVCDVMPHEERLSIEIIS